MTRHIWLRRVAQVLRTAAQGLTLWLPGTLLAATVALLAAAWLWTGTTGSLARLLNTARPWVPALAQLSWHTPGATVRNGGQLGTVNWQHNGLAVRASNVNLQWQWLAHNPDDTTPQGSRLRLTLTADDVHVTDRSPASTTPLTPPTHLALPWPFDSWAAPVELVFDVGQFTHAGAQPLVLQRLSGRHVYNPGAANWQHTLAVQTQVRSSPDKGTATPTTSAHYTLQARAQAHAPLALTATLTGDISGSLPASAAPAKLPAHAAPQPPRTWQGRLTATLNGTLATPQATLDAHATLTSQAAPGQQAPSAQLQARLAPWAAQPLSSLQTQVAQLDLAALWPTLPHTRLSGHAKASPTAANTWAFDVALANAASGPVDQQRLPVARLATTGHVAMGEAPLTTAVVLNTLDAQVAGGQVAGHGQWTANAWSGQLTATALHGPALHSALPTTTLQGALRAGPDTTHAAPHPASLFNVQVTATSGKNGSTIDSKQNTAIKRQASFSSEFVWDGQVIDLRTLALRSDGAVLSAQGTVQPQPFSASGQAQLRAPGLQADAQGQLSPLAGAGSLAVNLHQAAPLAQWLARLPVWPTTWPMPQVSGAAKLAATWTGGWEQDLQVTATAQASQLTGMLTRSPPSTSQKTAASLGTHTPTEDWAADNLSWTLSGGLAHWQSSLAGQLRWQQWAAHLQTTASGAMDQPNTGQARLHTFALALSPHNPPNTPQAPTAVRITLPDAAQLKWDTNGLSLDAGVLQVQPGTASASPPPTPAARLRWDRSTWAHSQLTSSGTLTGVTVQLARTLTQLLAPSATQAEPLAGWTGDLALGGPWQLRWPGTPLAPALWAASLTRQSGDLQAPTGLAASPGSVPSAPPGATSAPTPNATAPAPQQAQATGGTTRQTLGVRTASLAVKSDGQQLTIDADWDSQWAGQASARVALANNARVSNALPTADSALSGQLTARLPQAGAWSRLAPPGWRVTGSLALDATLGGTLAQPTWQGQLAARQLSARSAVEGLEYSQGELDATLSSNRMDITRFNILGAGGRERGGSLTLTGHATWAPPPATPTVSLQARAERLNVSARADRRLTVSGDVTASLAQHTLHLRGKLKADQAQFTLPDDTAPTLGPDVIVRLNRANAPPPPVDGLRTDVAVDVDLGSAFDLRGQGLQTQLTGQLRISSPPGSDTFSVTGEVRAANGTYKAYGQLLRIEEGVLRFSGPYDDPSLAILALRGSANPARANFGNDTQKVGVKVSGSARSPQLQLYADPELPDSEKLAWLVLGRPASGAGAEAAVMQQAAMALLGSQVRGMEGGLAHALGLDDVSVSQDTGNATTTPGTAVTLGKRLSSRLYVAYEHSLSSAAGALNLYYDVSRRLTVRAQVGGDNALDLIFTLPYD